MAAGEIIIIIGMSIGEIRFTKSLIESRCSRFDDIMLYCIVYA